MITIGCCVELEVAIAKQNNIGQEVLGQLVADEISHGYTSDN